MRTVADGAGEVVVDVWLPSYPAVPPFVSEARELAADFQRAHPGYVIDIRECFYRSLPEEVQRAAQRGEPPAVVQYFFTSTQLARDMRDRSGRPLFTPVERAVAGRTEILGEPVVLDDLAPAARAYYSYDGELLAVPPLTSTTLLYANTTLLAAAGVPELPRTWAELAGACKAVAGLPGAPPHGVTWPNAGWLFQQAVAQQGGLLADHANGRAGRAERVDLTSPALLAFVRWWRELHREGHYLYTGTRAFGDSTGQAWDQNFRAFAEQRVAFVLSTSVEADRMVEAGRDGGFTVRAGRMPHNGEVPLAGNVVGGDALWLTDGLDPSTRDAALAFMQFLLRPRHAAERHKSTRFMPVTGSAVELLEREGWFDRNPHHRAAIDQLAAADGSPASRGALVGDLAGIHGVVTQAMDDVLARGAAPERRLARATREAQRLLDEYNAHCLGLRPGPRGPHRFDVN